MENIVGYNEKALSCTHNDRPGSIIPCPSCHTEYLYISFARAFKGIAAFGRLTKSVGYGTAVKDTLVRLIFYPTVNDDYGKSSILFYDLAIYRDKPFDDFKLVEQEKVKAEIDVKNDPELIDIKKKNSIRNSK